MICQQCGKKQAITQIRTNINGVVNEYNLCSDCAKKMGYTISPESHFMDFDDILGSFFGSQQPAISRTSTRCPVCGADYNDIRKSGKVGCAECYNVFRSRLLPTIQRIHGNTKQCGKNPIGTAMQVVPDSKLTVKEEKKEQTELEKLQAEMNEAIKKQDFEQAAVIRDKIKKLNSEGGEGNE